MSRNQYLKALGALGLTPSGKQTAEVLGLSLRQCQRIAAGACEVPAPIAKLIEAYQRHGLPR